MSPLGPMLAAEISIYKSRPDAPTRNSTGRAEIEYSNNKQLKIK